MTLSVKNPEVVGEFLRANEAQVRRWMLDDARLLNWFCVVAVVAGAGAYGAAIGSWREPLQSLYAGIKLPLAILLTTTGNGLLNGMLAPLLGMNVSLRQSLLMVLYGFAVTALLLGALSPVALFIVWNTPPLSSTTWLTSPEYCLLQLTLACFVAIAGIVGCARLWPLLRAWAGSVKVSAKVMLAWLVTNLLLGSQVCWVLRPFVWDPAGQTRFIGQEYLRGSFFETIFEAVRRLIFS